MNDRTLLVWGDVGAGKSSLLAAALLGRQAERLLPMVDWRVSLPIAQVEFQRHWGRLTRNLPANPTTDARPGVRLQLHKDYGGGGIVFQDWGGESCRRPEEKETQEKLDAADGVLFVQEWAGTGPRWSLLDSARMALGDQDKARRRPALLAFTKCEQRLDRGTEAWRDWAPRTGGQPWWATYFRRPQEVEFLSRMDAVCPTSVYGYREEKGTHAPACLLDEFGEVVPYNIDPVNATEVVAWFMQRWQL